MPPSTPESPGRIAFLFAGQGDQYAGVARDLYDNSSHYAVAFDECLDLFEAVDLPLRRWWQHGDEVQLRNPRPALALTFAVEYALARGWQGWGVTPDVLLGVSIGEMTAGTVAGVFPLDAAVRAIAIRSQAVQDLPPGGLLAVLASSRRVAPLLPDGVWIAVVLGQGQLVVSGPADLLAETAVLLDAADLACYPVPTTHAAHGPVAAPAVPIFERALRRLPLAPPTIELYSANSCRPVTAPEAVDPAFWARQLAEPMDFAGALDALTGTTDRLLLIEIGPAQTLTKVVRRHPTVLAGQHRVLPTLAYGPIEPLAHTRSVLAAIGEVAAQGHHIDWSAVPSLPVAAPVDRQPAQA
jgi:phthiocerol/phenolphthiocerol synthesis type-I polyketide synthase E